MQILNVQLDDAAWLQASLPISAGGLDIRRAVMLSSYAFLSSMHDAEDLACNILSCTSTLQQDSLSGRALQCWDAQVGAALSSSQILQPSLQKSWDKHVIEASYNSLLRAAADEHTRARLLSVAAPHAGVTG